MHGRDRRIISSTRLYAQLLFPGRHAADCHELSCPVTRWRWDLTGILIRSASSVSTGSATGARAPRAPLCFSLELLICSILMLVSSSRMRCCVVDVFRLSLGYCSVDDERDGGRGARGDLVSPRARGFDAWPFPAGEQVSHDQSDCIPCRAVLNHGLLVLAGLTACWLVLVWALWSAI